MGESVTASTVGGRALDGSGDQLLRDARAVVSTKPVGKRVRSSSAWRLAAVGTALCCLAWLQPAGAQEVRVRLDKSSIASSSEPTDFSGLVDEQDLVGDPPAGQPQRGWEIPSQQWKQFPYAATLDLKQHRNLSALWIFDTHGVGDLVVSAGGPDRWDVVCRHTTQQYQQWARLPLDVTTRRLRIELQSPGAMFTEIALYE